MNCAECKEKACYNGKDCTKITEDAEEAYKGDAEVLQSLIISAQIESRYYMKKTRIEELILYAKGMGYKKLGVAFCIFTKYSEAPVTTLAVKDRVLAHNPLGALYSGYYRRRIRKE